MSRRHRHFHALPWDLLYGPDAISTMSDLKITQSGGFSPKGHGFHIGRAQPTDNRMGRGGRLGIPSTRPPGPAGATAGEVRPITSPCASAIQEGTGAGDGGRGRDDVSSGRMGDAPMETPEAASVGATLQVLPGANGGPQGKRWAGGTWRAITFAPIGDGQTRRRGSDAVRVGLSLLVIVLCLVASKVNPSSEKAVVHAVTPLPNGVTWLVTAIGWIGSLGLVAVVITLALVSRRMAVIRDTVLSGAGAWLTCVLLGAVFGTTGGRPPAGAPHGYDLTFPVARVAATVAVATAALPYLSRWLQRSIQVTVVLLAVATIMSAKGLPLAVLASLAVGVLLTAIVHLIFGSPLGLPSADEVSLLLAGLGLDAVGLVPADVQEWGVGKFTGELDGQPIDVSVYGRDASDAQLLAKTTRYLFFRDSGPTLTFTRRQQVEHEAYVTLMAEQAGVRVSRVVAAGPAGPAKDALLITCPPEGRLLAQLAPFVMPPVTTDVPPAGKGHARGDRGTGAQAEPGPEPGSDEVPRTDDVSGTDDAPGDLEVQPIDPVLTDVALDGIFAQLLALRSAGIAHGSFSPRTIVLADDGTSGFIDMRAAATVATVDQLDRDLAGVLAATALVAGPERATAAAVRAVPMDALVAALPFLQRAALDPKASRALRGRKSILDAVRTQGAEAAGVEVPKLIEPRRISWVNLLLVVGTLIGGWALIGVLVNVTKSWSTITGARWGWVAVVFVLAQAVYPALAITTIGSVTDTMPYGRTVALEVANTFVSLAGGSMGALATRVRFFQQQGYNATLAVSSGVLISTASWITKGALFLIALPIAFSRFHFASQPSSTGGGSGSSTAHLVWIIVIAIVVVGVVLGLVLAIPRWRRLASAKLRPKVSEVWHHLVVLSTHPRTLVEIFGGELAAQLLVAMALGASLHAFGEHLSLASLLIVLTLGSMLGGISPVPGGMGVVEAGMIVGLTAAGIPESEAVAAVFVQRLFTAYLPPIWGWFCLIWMRKREYL